MQTNFTAGNKDRQFVSVWNSECQSQLNTVNLEAEILHKLNINNLDGLRVNTAGPD